LSDKVAYALINRSLKQVEIYRLKQGVEILDAPQLISGEPLLPGFILNLASVW
jgi:Uma2 family endonuclease